MKKSLIGYQVYSARDDAAKDLPGTLKAIKALGYDGVEFAGFYGHEANAVKAMLGRRGSCCDNRTMCPSPRCAKIFSRSFLTTS